MEFLIDCCGKSCEVGHLLEFHYLLPAVHVGTGEERDTDRLLSPGVEHSFVVS